jgi:phage baseplate assembly protein W
MIENVRGLAFPFRIDPATGGAAWASGRDKVAQNLRVILGTRTGERPMARSFGTGIAALVHNPNDDVLTDVIEKQVQQALLEWEPRILVTEVQVERRDAELVMRLSYIHTQERVAGQMVLPLS